MSILDLFRPKTIASYRPDQVGKGMERFLDGTRLAKVFRTSLQRMTDQELLENAETLTLVVAGLADDIFLRKLSDPDLAQLNESIPRLIELFRLAPVPLQAEIAEMLHHLQNPVAAPFMVERLRELAAKKEIFLDRQEVLVLSSLVRYFILVPQAEALEPLLTVYRRAKNLYMETNLTIDPQKFRIWSLQALCEVGKKDPAPRLIEFLQKLEKSQSPDRGLAKEILVSIESGQVAAAVTNYQA